MGEIRTERTTTTKTTTSTTTGRSEPDVTTRSHSEKTTVDGNEDKRAATPDTGDAKPDEEVNASMPPGGTYA